LHFYALAGSALYVFIFSNYALVLGLSIETAVILLLAYLPGLATTLDFSTLQ